MAAKTGNPRQADRASHIPRISTPSPKILQLVDTEPGYRSKIKPNSVDYLKVTEKEERMATQSEPRNYPSLEYVRELVDSIVIRNEVDQRDQTLISFALLSGMRDQAIASLP
jgi:hypothetical protein